MEPNKIIELNQFSFSYNSQQLVLDNISLSIDDGMVHGILGNNGAGKTTLFNCLFNYHQYPTHIQFAEKAQKNIAYLQTEAFFYSYMTGFEYLYIICQHAKADVIADWNALFKLPLQEYVHRYSTGMKKKLNLLGVILLNKQVIILDEPFNGLDLETCEVVNYIIQRLVQIGKTIILSSHILETLLSNANKISFLEAGSIVKTFEKEEFPALRELVALKFRSHVMEKIDTMLQP